MFKRIYCCLYLILVCSLLPAATGLRAQTGNSGSIEGVVKDPSGAAIAGATGGFENFTGSSPYDPTTVGGLLTDVYTNVAHEDASGVDLLIAYTVALPLGTLGLSANGTYQIGRAHV